MIPTIVRVNATKIINGCDSDRLIEWLYANIGRGVIDDIDAWRNINILWSGWTDYHNMKIIVEFRYSEDAALFALRWAA